MIAKDFTIIRIIQLYQFLNHQNAESSVAFLFIIFESKLLNSRKNIVGFFFEFEQEKGSFFD